MRRLVARLAVAALLVTVWGVAPARAATPQTVKPYIVLILDVSGSMAQATGYGPPSCSTTDTKMDHAKCAIQKIANSYGEMVMALARFRVKAGSDNVCNDGNGCSTATAASCNCDPNTGTGTCFTPNGDDFEILVPIVANNQPNVLVWTNNVCTTCGPGSGDPELFAIGSTPIASSLVGDKLYWQGLPSPNNGAYWTGAGADPIRNDPLKDVFDSPGNQCRPYITIVLTDGDETCTAFTNTTNAAAALLTTAVDGKSYRIETKPIGFGKAKGDTQIEGLAHAGGTPDDSNPNTYEGAYANNEDDVELAISTIIAKSLKFESCNDKDDDCDTLVDEDFPDKGKACDDGGLGVCKGTGTLVCDAQGTGVTCQITNPGGTATTEKCNNLDDDCDGAIDEGACTSCGTVELCNNKDDDCDGKTDEGLTRPCGTDVGECTAGTETCSAGQWINCTATGPFVETCNKKDDDCDGTVDGFAQDCTTMPPPGNPNVGVCHPGTQVCPPGGNGTFQQCIGEIKPTTEVCNNLDDDCDGTTDEDTGGADCSSTCGVGKTVCQNGTIVCMGNGGMGTPELCNNFDDDCDGSVDEDVADGGPCDGGGTICNGVLKCMGGAFVCVGDQIHPETCNCKDDDCDLKTDEEPPALCPSGATCTSCQCAFPCGTGEFPCPVGKMCNSDNFCVNDPCFNVTCGPDGQGNKQECKDGACVTSCSLITCSPGTVCVGSTGTCEFDDCRTFPDRCKPTEQCVGGTCVDNPCADVTCPTDQYCEGGTCHASCAGLHCDAGQVCELGQCVNDPCGHPCPTAQVCNTSSMTCVTDPCLHPSCAQGEACDPQTGGCVPDPCLNVKCPGTGQICKQGSCYDPSQFQPDAGGPPQYVTTGGGGGCAANGGGGGVLLVLAMFVATRRRARGGRS